MLPSPSKEVKILEAQKIRIFRDASGILKVKIEGENEEYPVKPIRCFPLTGAEHYLGLYKIEPDGTIKKEIAFISDFKRLDENSQKLIKEELNKTYPLTWIKKVLSIKPIREALIWQVETEKGKCTFEVQHQGDIYTIQPSLVVVKDKEGNRYQINSAGLDPKSLAQLEIYT